MSATERPPVRVRAAFRRLMGKRRGGDDRSPEYLVVEGSGAFDRDYYIATYPDVAASGMDPLEHYLRHGAAEGRNPSKVFNTLFYQRANPDVVASGQNPLAHFCQFGWREGRNPSSAFDLRAYASRNGLAEDVNPLLHIMRNSAESPQWLNDSQLFGQPGLFDADFYTAQYPDVSASGVDPFQHFVEFGVKEGRNPSAFFDSGYYLKTNPDVARAGIPAFSHFCRHGWRELRNPSPRFHLVHYWLEHMVPAGASGNPLAHFGALEEGHEVQPPAIGSGSPATEQQLIARAESAVTEANHDTETLEMLGRMLVARKRFAVAETAFRQAVAARWESASLHSQLASTLEAQGKWWEAAESLERATVRDESRASWFFRLGDAHERMNRLAPAAIAFRRAIALSPKVAKWHYRLGHVLEKDGLQDEADCAYEQAVGLDGRAAVSRFGPGYLHQERRYWPEAAVAYARSAADSPLDAELRYRLGMALDRCYQWAEAQVAYEEAIALDPDIAYWHYRLGFVLERQGQWVEAAGAYAAGVLLSDKFVPYWAYRQGYVLQKAGLHRMACDAYIGMVRESTLRTLPKPIGNQDSNGVRDHLRRISRLSMAAAIRDSQYTKAGAHVTMARQYELNEDWEAAANAYELAIARSNDHPYELYLRLGMMWFLAGRYDHACDAFVRSRVLSRPYGVSMEESKASKSVIDCYREFSHLPILERVIVYESYHGKSIGCNPGAIFRYLLDAAEFSEWIHVWIVDGAVGIPTDLTGRRNVIFARRNSALHARYLATASHLISNNTFPAWFCRRAGQKYLNTWHGTPLKSLGRDIKGQFMAHQNAARNLLHATHLISPNEHTSNVLLNSNDIAGSFSGLLAETGYPRIDWTLNQSNEDKARIAASLGLDPGIPVVLYAPTWRGSLGQVDVDHSSLLKTVEAMASSPCQVLFRGHHMAQSALRELDIPALVVPDEIDTNELLSIVDVLVTDYSSVFFDYLPLKRPIIFYAYDIAQYEEDRGFCLDVDSLPGDVCENLSDLVRVLHGHLERDIFERQEGAIATFCPREDGNATSRVVDFFFNGSNEWVVGRGDGKKGLLFYAGGFIPNGITNSLLNLVRNLDDGEYQTTVVIDPVSVGKEPSRISKFEQLPSAVQVVARTGGMTLDPEQAWVGSQFRLREGQVGEEMRRVYGNAYRHEFLRCFGDAKFDVAIQFDGYIPHWTSVFAFAPDTVAKIIYLHNDMKGEFETRFPFLARSFRLYDRFDGLVSVSKSVNQANITHLSAHYGLPAHRFFQCDNLLDIDAPAVKALEPLDPDLEEWIGQSKLLGTLGRLSPEKGHRKLINAFREVLERVDEDLKLAIAGDGPLKTDLQSHIDELGLRDRVRLVGQLANPFPFLKRMDLFVFSSDYEGQGIAILEALMMGKSVVATDVVGPRTVLEDGYGALVENSESGLADGIVEHFLGSKKYRDFNARNYQEDAISSFQNLIATTTKQSIRTARTPSWRRASKGQRQRMIVALRTDGLGERLNAMVNGMYIASRLDYGFGFVWESSGSWQKLGVATSLHAVSPMRDFFSEEFIDEYSLPSDFKLNGLLDIEGREVGESHLESKLSDNSFNGWIAPRLDLRQVLDKHISPDPGQLGAAFREISFSDRIEKVIAQARSSNIPSNCVALHLRSGDIFYGPYRKLVNYTYKGLTLPIAKALIDKMQADGKAVLLFGQDSSVLDYLRKDKGCLVQEDFSMNRHLAADEQAMFDIVLMSRCEAIIAGSSGFAKLASWIGNRQLISPHKIFTPTQQTEISISDLKLHASSYHPLQTAFAYWYAYYCGRQEKSFDQADWLLSKAQDFDPDNQLYPIKRAAVLIAGSRRSEAETVLANMIQDECTQSDDLPPCFGVLLAKTTGKYNLEEDFELIHKAASPKHPHIALCSLAIKRSMGRLTKDDRAALTSLALSENPVVSSLAKRLHPVD